MKKNNLFKITILLLMFLMIPFNVYAKDNVVLNRIDSGKNSVNLVLENVNTISKAFQISLKIEGAKYDSITPSEYIDKSGRINVKMKNDIITIYATSRNDLVNEEGNIEIGVLKVKGNVGDTFNIIPADNANFKLVTYKNSQVSLSTMNYTGDNSFTVVDDKKTDNNNNNNQNNTNQNNNNSTTGNNTNGGSSTTNNSNLGEETTNQIIRDENSATIVNDDKTNVNDSNIEVTIEKENEDSNLKVEASFDNDKLNIESDDSHKEESSKKESNKNNIFLIISPILCIIAIGSYIVYKKRNK